MIRRGGHFWRSVWLSGPGIAWMTICLVVPLLLTVWMSFMTQSADGAAILKFTTENYGQIGGNGPAGYDPQHLELIVRSLSVGFITTAICLLTAVPAAFFIAGLSRHLKTFAIVLIVVPLWSNILFRTYGWQVLLSPDSWLIGPLMSLGLVDVHHAIFPSWTAMQIGMVCTYLPFMIIPVFISVDKVDWTQLEAARDLGAGRIDAFKESVLPQLQPGLVAGMVFVFLPSVGQFVVPDLLGGSETYLLGNALEREFAVTQNWPLGAAYDVVALCVLALGLVFHTAFTRDEREREPIVL